MTTLDLPQLLSMVNDLSCSKLTIVSFNIYGFNRCCGTIDELITDYCPDNFFFKNIGLPLPIYLN